MCGIYVLKYIPQLNNFPRKKHFENDSEKKQFIYKIFKISWEEVVTYFLVRQGKSVSIPLNVSKASFWISGTFNWGKSMSNFCFWFSTADDERWKCLLCDEWIFVTYAGNWLERICFFDNARIIVLNLACEENAVFPDIFCKIQNLQTDKFFIPETISRTWNKRRYTQCSSTCMETAVHIPWIPHHI